MNKIFAVDPGNFESGFVIYDFKKHKLLKCGTISNSVLRKGISNYFSKYKDDTYLVIEMIASYGMPVGKTVMNTLLYIGRLVETAERLETYPHLLTRKQCTLNLCMSNRANDATVRRALLDKFEATGGGKTPEVGIKSNKGPLFGCTGDALAALAVAITFNELKASKGVPVEVIGESDIPKYGT